MEDNKNILEEQTKEDTLPKKPKTNKNSGFKTKKCNVLSYDEIAKTLDIDFDGYGIRFRNVEKTDDSVVEVKYKGEIGKPNFEYKL